MTFPDHIVSHSKTQITHFGSDGLMRRHDYTVDILGGATGANYTTNYRDFQGIKMPTTRRIYAYDGGHAEGAGAGPRLARLRQAHLQLIRRRDSRRPPIADGKFQLMSTEILFKPLQLGALSLPNRIVMPALTRMRAGPGGVPTALNAEYYGQRASAGLNITEATAISVQGHGYPNMPGIHSAGADRRVAARHRRGACPRRALRAADRPPRPLVTLLLQS